MFATFVPLLAAQHKSHLIYISFNRFLFLFGSLIQKNIHCMLCYWELVNHNKFLVCVCKHFGNKALILHLSNITWRKGSHYIICVKLTNKKIILPLIHCRSIRYTHTCDATSVIFSQVPHCLTTVNKNYLLPFHSCTDLSGMHPSMYFCNILSE